MENTKTTSEVKTFDYEGKIPEHKQYHRNSDSDFGLYLILFLFAAVFFGVILFQMYA